MRLIEKELWGLYQNSNLKRAREQFYGSFKERKRNCYHEDNTIQIILIVIKANYILYTVQPIRHERFETRFNIIMLRLSTQLVTNSIKDTLNWITSLRSIEAIRTIVLFELLSISCPCSIDRWLTIKTRPQVQCNIRTFSQSKASRWYFGSYIHRDEQVYNFKLYSNIN